MAETKKPRITLAELASVEVGTADLGDADPSATDATNAAPAPEAAPTAADSAELSQLPVGVSPQVAELLRAPEPEPEPEAPSDAAPAPPAAPAPADAATSTEEPRSRAGLFVGALLAAGVAAGGAWFAMSPPPLSAAIFAAGDVSTTAPDSPDTRIAFREIPAPIVEEAEPEVAAPEPRRRRAPEPGRVTREDLF